MQIARKPTTLMLLRKSHIADRLSKLGKDGRCNHRGHAPLTGRGDRGAFKTAQAKVYTSDFCEVLASGVLHGVASRGFKICVVSVEFV